MHTQQWNPYFISIKCQCVGLWKFMDQNIIFMVSLLYNHPKLEPFCYCYLKMRNSYAQRDCRLHVVSTVAQNGQTTLLLERAFCLFSGHCRGGWDERWSFGCKLQPQSLMILNPLHWSFLKRKYQNQLESLFSALFITQHQEIAYGTNLFHLLICKLLCMLYIYSYNFIVYLSFFFKNVFFLM